MSKWNIFNTGWDPETELQLFAVDRSWTYHVKNPYKESPHENGHYMLCGFEFHPDGDTKYDTFSPVWIALEKEWVLCGSCHASLNAKGDYHKDPDDPHCKTYIGKGNHEQVHQKRERQAAA